VAETRIANGQAVLRQLRRNMAMFVVTASLAFVVLSIINEAWFVEHKKQVLYCSWNFGEVWRLASLSSLYYGRIILVSLAPPADDVKLTRLALLADVAAILVFAFYCARQFVFSINYWHSLFNFILMMLDVLCALGLLATSFCTSARSMQTWMWRVLQTWVFSGWLLGLLDHLNMSILCGHPSILIMWAPPKLLLSAMMWKKNWRYSCHAQLLRVFEQRSEKRAAASIAGLVGSCSPEEALSQAKVRFRSVQLADLTLDDFRDNTPNQDLFLRSNPELLGECDAFFSHSWRDDPETKWRAMQQWRAAFVLEYDREPKVWIDICCIDQSNIESDLRCLPVFLSGCTQFVIFFGPTYLNRLWCVVEFFTFVQMCRAIDNIDVQLLLQDGCERQSSQTMAKHFDRFDARECECFLAEDKEKMLNIILGAFGDLPSFNREVSSIFRQVGVGTEWQARLHHFAHRASSP